LRREIRSDSRLARREGRNCTVISGRPGSMSCRSAVFECRFIPDIQELIDFTFDTASCVWHSAQIVTDCERGKPMPNEEWGTKRICPTTGKRFYDLNKDPIISPYTGETVTLDANKGRTMVADAEDVQTTKMNEADTDTDEVVLDDDDVDVDLGDDVLDDDDDDTVSLDEIADVATDDDDT